VIALVVSLCLAQPEPVTLTKAELEQAEKTFQVKGGWISPVVVNEFLPFVSDHSRPIVRVIDVAAALESNRAFGDVVLRKGAVHVDKEQGEFIEYTWLGRAKNGQHVLLVSWSGGGSGVFVSLATFTLKAGTARDENGASYPTLELAVQRVRSLGDRVVPNLKLSGNRVAGSLECVLPSCKPQPFSMEL
jgi:hypothetical protein